MSILQEQFKSDFGFESTNFVVDATGNITAKRIDVRQLLINGVPFVGEDPDTTPVPTDPEDSTEVPEIEFPTKFDRLLVTGSTVVRLDDSSEILTIREGVVKIASGNGGTIDNIEIGSITPSAATFTDLNATNDTALNTLTVAGNLLVAGTTSYTQNISVEEEKPLDNTHLTRKDYVDSQISAFAIAFGV